MIFLPAPIIFGFRMVYIVFLTIPVKYYPVYSCQALSWRCQVRLFWPESADVPLECDIVCHP